MNHTGRSNFEKLREADQIPTSAIGDHNDIFETYTAHPRVVESRFNGHDLIFSKSVARDQSERRRFMDVQAESVARPVKEPLHAAIPQSGLKALAPEVTENVLVQFVRAGAGPNLIEPYFLSLFNGLIGLFQPF